MTHAQVGRWQKQVLQGHGMNNNNDGSQKTTTTTTTSCWRPYVTRHVSFVDLDTPYTEALLALSPDGSYMLGACDDVERGTTTTELPSAYLCIRGVPSPATLKRISAADTTAEQECCAASPRLLTIPLDFSVQGVRGRFSKRKILISLCQDWRMGLYLGPMTNTPRDPAALVTVFPLPRALRDSDEIVHSYKTTRTISFPDVSGSLEGYNLLWEVEFTPRASKESLEPEWNRQCACLCVLKVASEIRLTWFVEADTPACLSPLAHREDSKKMGRSLEGFLVGCGESIWEVAQSNRLDGSLVNSRDSKRTGQRIQKAHEMVLNLDLLVHDILKHRPKLAKRYDCGEGVQTKSEVIDVVHEGRVMNLLITFSPGKAKHPLALVVSIDLISATYRELNWMKSTTVFAHIDMRTLCANFRMKLLRCGPFETERPDHEKSFEAEEGAPGLHFTNKTKEYCFMPLSALYTDTQVVSNSNILCAVPRMSIKSTQSPLELVYYGDS